MEALRVAVVGAGVSGCAFSWNILKQSPGRVSVTLFEMGRGAGGRSATRRSRDLPDLSVNHGSPLFHLRSDNSVVLPLIESLLHAGSLSLWNGTAGCLDINAGTTKPGPASRGEPVGQSSVARYIGSPAMSSLGDGILQLAGKENLKLQYGIQVASIQPRSGQGTVESWTLRSKDGSSLGEFDWVVISSSTMAHPRWQETFGQPPPMQVAAQQAGVAQLSDAVNHLATVTSQPAHVVMLAWETSNEDSGIIGILQKLPFDVTVVEGDDSLAKVVRQSPGPKHVVVVLHSTVAFAKQHSKVFGSTGTAARMGAHGGSAEEEGVVTGALWNSFKLLLNRQGAGELVQPTWGPVLHRWGSAFPEGPAEADPRAKASLMIPQARATFIGDYLAPPYACVETALQSGIEAAVEILNANAIKHQEL
eukprot:gnl/MRDRNA2_/MRDRNA2_130301_c0_seq1.p1 gnl/MRDRNA2_/MRDRNA2_130301_c0~~gnl/MRDRNA2_/MRDRNA2_130301_c0_seq1.p1  ORF type:complete len:420 (-),score=78.66 gnl/MRDRNA2_/MRDRNA2_130301_c0_seq1:188-1447(-)